MNKLGDAAKAKIIEQDHGALRSDLNQLISDRSIPIILIKANVGRVLEPKLARDMFNVLNKGRVIYFPGMGWQNRFKRQFRAVLKYQDFPRALANTPLGSSLVKENDV